MTTRHGLAIAAIIVGSGMRSLVCSGAEGLIDTTSLWEAYTEKSTQSAPTKSAKAAETWPPTWQLAPDLTMRLRGHVDTDALWSTQSPTNEATFGDLGDVVGLRRARIGIEGNAGDNGRYVAEIDLASGFVVPRDVYLACGDRQDFGEGQVGHLREPFSLEGGTSAKYFAFMERSPVNLLDPARNWGLALFRESLDADSTVALGAFHAGTNPGDFQGGDGATVGLTGRWTTAPINEDDGAQLLHFGIALSERVPENGVIIVNQQPRSPLPRSELRRANRGRPAVPRQLQVARTTTADEQESILVPPLVSQELFEAAAQRLEENRRRYRAQKQGAEFLLSGLLVCARCQSAYCGRRATNRDGSRYVYYRCLGTDKYRCGGEAICSNQSLTGAPFEKAVWTDLCNLLQQPERLQREFERRLQQAAPEMDVTHCAATMAQLKGRMARLLDAYEHGCLEQRDFLERTARVRERLAQEEAEQQRIQEAQRGACELRLVVSQLESFAEQLADGLETADFATKRKLLRLLVNRIEVDADEVRIQYKVQPRPFAQRPTRGDLQHCLMFHR